MNYFVKPIHNIIWNKNIVDFTKFLQINSVFFIELALVALQIMAKTESEEDALVLSAFDSLIEALKDNPKGQKHFLKTVLQVNMAYDKVTGSSIVQKLLTGAPFETVQFLAKMFKEALQGQKADGSTYR